MPETAGASTAGRWWEYYVLRYFVGTVTGAMVLLYLTKLKAEPRFDSGSAAFRRWNRSPSHPVRQRFSL